MAANETTLGLIHDLLANKILAKLKNGDPIEPAEMGHIIRFLKDNGIEADAKSNRKLQEITDRLPTFDEDGDDNVIQMAR